MESISFFCYLDEFSRSVSLGRQQSDSLGYDGGAQTNDVFDNIMFAPAEPTDSLKKKKKDKKRRQSDAASQKTKNAAIRNDTNSTATTSVEANGNRTTASKKTTPPPKPTTQLPPILGEDDLCYAEWWMSCFPDALFKEMMPQQR